MKKIFLVLFLFTIIFTSCDEYYHNGTIQQEVELSLNAFAKEDDYILKTVVHYNSELVSLVFDEIDINYPNEVEVIKSKRYKEAIVLIDKLRAIDDMNVSKK